MELGRYLMPPEGRLFLVIVWGWLLIGISQWAHSRIAFLLGIVMVAVSTGRSAVMKDYGPYAPSKVKIENIGRKLLEVVGWH